MHKHHVVFRSQGGLDFELNYKYLSLEAHEGSAGPHLNRKVDLIYKKELQDKLENVFTEEIYTIEEIAKLLGRTKKYFEKHFKRVAQEAGAYRREDIIRKLMGGKLY